jgi:hypothetical protein
LSEHEEDAMIRHLQRCCEHYANALRNVEAVSIPGTETYRIAREALTTARSDLKGPTMIDDLVRQVIAGMSTERVQATPREKIEEEALAEINSWNNVTLVENLSYVLEEMYQRKPLVGSR